MRLSHWAEYEKIFYHAELGWRTDLTSNHITHIQQRGGWGDEGESLFWPAISTGNRSVDIKRRQYNEKNLMVGSERTMHKGSFREEKDTQVRTGEVSYRKKKRKSEGRVEDRVQVTSYLLEGLWLRRLTANIRKKKETGGIKKMKRCPREEKI